MIIHLFYKKLETDFYKEQLQSKEDMLVRTTRFLLDTQLELKERNKELYNANQDVFNSIKFAELIQTSLLPDIDILKIFIKDASYKVMQQIGIGGDTVFIKNTNGGIFFGLFDATGHGIPAAMLSISGVLMLNELTGSMEVDSPKVLLKLLNYRLNSTFNADKSLAHMEGIMCLFSSKLRTLTYSSANGKGLLVSATGEIIELFSTKKPIGEHAATEFENFEIHFKQGDKLFLYSDGLTDQFGGDRDKKFSRLKLKRILADNYKKNVNEINKIIETEHESWKKTTQQTDDISFMIIEF